MSDYEFNADEVRFRSFNTIAFGDPEEFIVEMSVDQFRELAEDDNPNVRVFYVGHDGTRQSSRVFRVTSTAKFLGRELEYRYRVGYRASGE